MAGRDRFLVAKKRTIRKQMYADRYRGRFSFGGDASTAVFESFNTGMNVGRETAYKWTLMAATIGPANTDDMAGMADNELFHAQLMIGTHTAFVEQDDMQCITDVMVCRDYVTSGGTLEQWPVVFPILSPLPVFAQTLTIGMQGTNLASQNSKEYAYCLWYVPTPTNETEMVEYLAAFGQV